MVNLGRELFGQDMGEGVGVAGNKVFLKVIYTNTISRG